MRSYTILAAIAASLVLARGAALAEEQFAARNTAGGHIVLSDRPCPFDAAAADGLQLAFTYQPGVSFVRGCWAYLPASRVVRVVWLDDGRQVDYDPAQFERVDGELIGDRRF